MVTTSGSRKVIDSPASCVSSVVPSSWAMPCFPVTGIQNGVFTVPALGAGVWVEFEQGNPPIRWTRTDVLRLIGVDEVAADHHDVEPISEFGAGCHGGDDVLVQLAAGKLLIGELAGRSARELRLRQFNPDVTFRVDPAEVEVVEPARVSAWEGQAKGGVRAGRDAHVMTVHAPKDGDATIGVIGASCRRFALFRVMVRYISTGASMPSRARPFRSVTRVAATRVSRAVFTGSSDFSTGQAW